MFRGFSWKISLFCLVLASGMTRAAFWQWDRHLWKLGIIEHLETNLRQPITPLIELLTAPPSEVAFRRVTVKGSFDFEREMLLRNRRFSKADEQGLAGFHVLTPLKISGYQQAVLVDRGFMPLGSNVKESLSHLVRPGGEVEINVLIKESATTKFFAPKDPEAGLNKPWVLEWLRVDLLNIQKQVPYPILQFFAEELSLDSSHPLKDQIVKESSGGRSEILSYSGLESVKNFGLSGTNMSYPIPMHDTTPPANIHLGYVYEWGFMALLTISIGAISQMPRNWIWKRAGDQ